MRVVRNSWLKRKQIIKDIHFVLCQMPNLL